MKTWHLNKIKIHGEQKEVDRFIKMGEYCDEDGNIDFSFIDFFNFFNEISDGTYPKDIHEELEILDVLHMKFWIVIDKTANILTMYTDWVLLRKFFIKVSNYFELEFEIISVRPDDDFSMRLVCSKNQEVDYKEGDVSLFGNGDYFNSDCKLSNYDDWFNPKYL